MKQIKLLLFVYAIYTSAPCRGYIYEAESRGGLSCLSPVIARLTNGDDSIVDPFYNFDRKYLDKQYLDSLFKAQSGIYFNAYFYENKIYFKSYKDIPLDLKVTMSNMLGQIVWVKNDLSPMSTAFLSNGMYFITLTGENGKLVEKYKVWVDNN